MITQVSGVNTKGVASSLRQNSRPVSFMYSSNPPKFEPKINRKASQSPVWTGTSIVLGSVLFMMAYLAISGSRRV